MPGRQRDNQFAMNVANRARRYDPAARRRASDSRTAFSISDALRTSIGLNSTPSDGATAWIMANWPIPSGMAGSRRTAARVTRGAISLSSPNHFALTPYSNWIKPVMLPPGWPSS